MDFDEFGRRLSGVRDGSIVAGFPPEFKVFEFLSASVEEIQRAEAALGATLPGAYREFMVRYGGGQFLFVDLVPVVSADEREPDLVEVNRLEGVPAFVVVAPVGTGDWWGFEVDNGVCNQQVSFWYHDDKKVEPTYAEFLDFLSAVGLRSSDALDP